MTTTLANAPWSRRHWLVALVPGTFFGLVNAVQNLRLADEGPGLLGSLLVLAAFLLAFNLIAPILRCTWALSRRFSSALGGVSRTRLLQAGWAVGSALGHLSLLAVLTSAVRAPDAWRAALPVFLEEILVTCSPVWIAAYGVTLWTLRSFRNAPSPGSPPDVLAFRDGPTTRIVPLEDLRLLRAEGNYVRVETAEESRLVRTALRDLEDSLPTRDFLRVHRSVIVRTDRIRSVERTGTGAYTARLADGREIPVSRRRLAPVRRTLEGPSIRA